MPTVNPARMTHDYDGELVVFLIGMRINQLWRPDLWWPVFSAMPRMLAELMTDPESGLMGYRLTFGRGGPLLVQYWNSHEKLYAYASNPTAAHRPAWTPVQPDDPQGTRGRRHLARDLRRGAGRDRLLRHAARRPGRGDRRRPRRPPRRVGPRTPRRSAA